MLRHRQRRHVPDLRRQPAPAGGEPRRAEFPPRRRDRPDPGRQPAQRHPQWRPEPAGTTGGYRFVARHGAKCLSVDAGSTANGARLSQQPCTQSAVQTFTLAAG
ncbi:RICIN domain-containing protein [Streptomyces sp. NPDC093065]|uniref:RICIN domain-containing protein n=1 Tax=Streptomyces sp. NPDC093065 TaxID=3366021 RepID=UPI003817190B